MNNIDDKDFSDEYSQKQPQNIEILDFDEENDNKVNFQIAFNQDENNVEILDLELEFNDKVKNVEVLDFEMDEVETLDFELDEIKENKEDAVVISDKYVTESAINEPVLTNDEPQKIEKIAVADDLVISKDTYDLVQKTLKKRKQRLLILLIVLLLALSFVVYKIVRWNLDNSAINKQIKEIIEEAEIIEVKNDSHTVIVDEPQPQTIEEYTDVYIDKSNDYYRYIDEPLINVNFTNLLEKNSDTVAWLKVNGTNINYPVVQSSDNKYYLTHAFDKSYNDAGWVFADYRNNLKDDRNLIIYGHARLNSTMFGTLKNVIKRDWYSNKNNYVIKLSTPNINSTWQVFSTYAIDPEDYYIRTDFENDSSFYEFAKILKARSVYDYNVEIKPTDRILTLSTCYSNNQRIVLHAKLIKYENRS